ncbi:glycosyltransferase family 8 C-terminal domain-containing protein [Providencia stuartii]|nr:glycosyltransferase family 8 C-terminal domain-containing protein [Providencia stuartii]
MHAKEKSPWKNISLITPKTLHTVNMHLNT